MRNNSGNARPAIETIGMINNRYEVNCSMPLEYYFQKVRQLDSQFALEKEQSLFFIPPFCYDLYMDTDNIDLSAYALSYMDGNQYDLKYYIDLTGYYKEKADYDRKLKLFELGDKEIFKREEEIKPLPRDMTSMSAEALAGADGYHYDFQYYIDLHKYYEDLAEYEKNMALFHAGDKDIFRKKETIIPFGHERSDMSAEALAEADGYQYDFQYYIDLRNYNIQMEEYNRKVELFHGGDRDVFNRKEKIVPFGREHHNLSPEALAEIDGHQYNFQYYKDLADYYRNTQEYERKLELFNNGDTDIFTREEEIIPFGRESYDLSGEALANLDGYQYDLEYYEQVSKYYRDTQEYNRKLELFNAGQKDIFKTEDLAPFSRERVQLTPRALQEADGYQYDFQYYIQLHDYYKELDEYNRKLDLFHQGHKDIFKQSEEPGRVIDIVNISLKEEKQKIWAPSIEELLSFSRGKASPYFLDTLFYMLKRIDGEFKNKIQGSTLKLVMDWKTSVVTDKEFLTLIKEIEASLVKD